MDTAPKDRPILAWCVHEADPYHIEGTNKLTLYGAHCEGLGHVLDGANVLVWGGGFCDTGEYGEVMAELSDWWFAKDSEFECPANPICWAEITEPEEFLK